MPELVSIHIPKTAGRSFLAILNSVYGENNVVHFDKKNFPDKKTPETLQFQKHIDVNNKVIHGHFTYKEARNFPQTNNARWITWVRDPVDRVISNYSFFKNRILASDADSELQLRRNESVLEYARLENSRNRMYKFMEGKKPDEFYFIGVMEFFETDVKMLASILEWKPFEIPVLNSGREFKSTMTQITVEERTIIEELNTEDVSLYQQVLELRNKRTK